ncbi:MAG: VWA domain-containing protein [Thermoanaerobaculia bacterium]
MPRFGFAVAAVLFAAVAFSQEAPRPIFEITVERYLLDLYVTDDRGEPIDDLRPMNFRVRLDGRPAEIEAVEFVDTTLPRTEVAIAGDDSGDLDLEPPRPRGRLIVLFFQTDFQREKSRIGGQMKMIDFAQEFVDGLRPHDRAAVVQFDSHFKVREDFTSDREKLRKAIEESVRIDNPGRPARVPAPSLMSRLDEREMKRAATPEKALFLLGNALLPIEGPKSLILFGWGLGRYGSGGVTMIPDYFPARRALEASRTAVFSIDISQSSFHSLEVGLETVSKETGGFYAKTDVFPEIAMGRLDRTLSARYELSIKRPPDLPRGLHKVEVKVIGRKGARVLVRETVEDK